MSYHPKQGLVKAREIGLASAGEFWPVQGFSSYGIAIDIAGYAHLRKRDFVENGRGSGPWRDAMFMI
ncbi:MAG: hypothetical protein ACNS61_16095 [Candidatus Wenzhouxiangella sp. M2_3B_020]